MEGDDPTHYQLTFLPQDAYVYNGCQDEEKTWMLCEYIKNHDQYPLEECYFYLHVCREEDGTCLEMAGHTWGRICDLRLPCHLISCVKWRTELHCDLNTALPLSCPSDAGVEDAFKSDKDVCLLFRRKFRVISTDSYLKNFVSSEPPIKDSSGNWREPPPSSPWIEPGDSQMNLHDFISTDPAVG